MSNLSPSEIVYRTAKVPPSGEVVRAEGDEVLVRVDQGRLEIWDRQHTHRTPSDAQNAYHGTSEELLDDTGIDPEEVEDREFDLGDIEL